MNVSMESRHAGAYGRLQPTIAPAPTPWHVDAFAILVISTSMAEMLFQLSGNYFIWLLLFYCPVAFMSSKHFRPQKGCIWFLIAATLYSLTAIRTGLEYGVVGQDLFGICQGVLIVIFLGIGSFDERRRATFMLNLHRCFLILGTVAGYLGLVKLMLLNRGVVLSPFVYIDGTPFPGSSLNWDYNVYSVCLVMCLGSAGWLLRRETNSILRYVAHLGIPAMVASPLFTSSRRALIFLGLALIAFIGSRLFSRNTTIRRSRLNGWVVAAAYVVVLFAAVINSNALYIVVENFLWQPDVVEVTERSGTITETDAIDTRTMRFEYALDVISTSDLWTVLVGDGFSYVGDMGVAMGEEYDYPHNFILSAMLYGGIVQTLATLLFVGFGLLGAWRAGPEYRIVAFWLVCLTFFHMTSSNSVFSMDLFVTMLLIASDLPSAGRVIRRVSQTRRLTSVRSHPAPYPVVPPLHSGGDR